MRHVGPGELARRLTTTTYNATTSQTRGDEDAGYDLNGNRTKDGSITDTWDARDRLRARAQEHSQRKQQSSVSGSVLAEEDANAYENRCL